MHLVDEFIQHHNAAQGYVVVANRAIYNSMHSSNNAAKLISTGCETTVVNHILKGGFPFPNSMRIFVVMLHPQNTICGKSNPMFQVSQSPIVNVFLLKFKRLGVDASDLLLCCRISWGCVILVENQKVIYVSKPHKFVWRWVV